MHRIALALAFLVGVAGFGTTAMAQKRGSEVTGPKISIKCHGLKKSTAEKLTDRLKDFQKRGEFKADLRKKSVTFCLNPKAQVSFSELKKAVEGDDKKFRLVWASIKLIGKMGLDLDAQALGKIDQRKRWKLAKQLRNVKGVSGLRPNNGGDSLDLTVAAPGIPLAKIDTPIAAAAKLDKGQSAVSDPTWHGPAEGGEKQGSKKGKKGRKKGSKKKGHGDGDGDGDEKKEDEAKEDEEKDED